MLLSDYIWSRNPRGMHNENIHSHIRRWRYTGLDLGWYKFVAWQDEYVDHAAWMNSVNITPVLRVYRPKPGAMPVDNTLLQLWQTYYRHAGVRWFEFYNEPNLPIEWPDGTWVDWRNAPAIQVLMENWLIFAETIITIGGYPGFPALTESATSSESAVLWLDAMLGYLRDNHRERFRHIINSGMYMAAHPATLNHFYQQTQGHPLVPRPPELVNGTEAGWHFEYPYDPLSQSLDPGRTVFGGTALTPYGDPSGIIAMGTAFHQRLAEWFDAGVVPVVGTEGGVYPTPLGGPQQLDTRYPPVTSFSHGEATVAMFNWIVTTAPPWMFGITVWKENEYYDHGLPALARMEQVPQLRKTVPPLSSGEPSNYQQQIMGRGPGPVHGEADFHLVILAPGLDSSWFFDTAQAYYNTFRPVVTTYLSFGDFMPYDKSMAATVIAPPDMAETMQQAIKEKYPNAVFDLIIASGNTHALTDIFNSRVWSNRRLG